MSLEKLTIHFNHGLGDVSNFAHIVALYVQHGYELGIQCTADKAILFRAAGAEIVSSARHHHAWPHANCSKTGPQAWIGNKSGYNLSRDPLPFLGPHVEVWPEYIAVRLDLDPFVTDEARQQVARIRDSLDPGPLILLHTQGNTGSDAKNLSKVETKRLYRSLLDRTDATLLLLDWDNRTPRLANRRVRHLTDDFQPLGLAALYELLKGADLLIAVDSGPLHFCRTTNTPALGVWTRNKPGNLAVPRFETVHLVTRRQQRDTIKGRLSYQIMECPTDAQEPDGSWIAEQAAEVLRLRATGRAHWARDLMIRQWLTLTRSRGGALSDFVDRHRSFGLALDFLRQLPHPPAMVETGTIREGEDWGGAGYSTYLFAAALQPLGGTLHSVDLNEKHVQFARLQTAGFGDTATIHKADSRTWLKQFAGPIDLFYADSMDTTAAGHDDCCLEEIKLALPLLRDESSRILIDDTVYHHGTWHGKGAKAVPFLLGKGWRIDYAGYQVLLTR